MKQNYFKFQRFVNEFDGLDTVINYFLLHAPEGTYGNAHYLNHVNRKLFNLIGKLSEIKTSEGLYTHKRKASILNTDSKKVTKLETKDMRFSCKDSKQMVTILNIESQGSNRKGKFSIGNILYDICQSLVTTDLLNIYYNDFSDVTKWIINNFPFDIVERHYFIIQNDNTFKQINIELNLAKMSLEHFIKAKAIKEKDLLTTSYKTDMRHEIITLQNSIEICKYNIKVLGELYLEDMKSKRNAIS